MKISITGLDEVKKAFSSYKKTKTDELRDEVNTAALNVDREAKKNAPVDTGRLRSSIHPVFAGTTDPETGERTSGLESEVVTNVEYAPIQEAVQPFLFPAWEAERPEHIKRVKDILRRL